MTTRAQAVWSEGVRWSHTVKDDTLIRAGRGAPLRGIRIETVSCNVCGDRFVIIHPVNSADADRAERQAARYKRVLAQEHLGQDFKFHCESLEGLEDE